MKKNILPFNWRSALDHEEAYSIDGDFIMLDKPVITSVPEYPFKMDAVVSCICLKGMAKGTMNMIPYQLQAPCFFVLLPEQILQYEFISEDFQGLFIIMSKRFLNDLQFNAHEIFPVDLSIRQNPCIMLNEREINAFTLYFDMMKESIQIKENPYRIKVAEHLTKAFFYGAGFHFYKLVHKKTEKTRREALLENFLTLVQTHYKEERELNFYADKLCLTPKHLSRVIKSTGHKSANEWINDRVILESRALLKSTNMTIQQISDELNFPSQSFFGKYFKRQTGMSPSEYKKM